MRDLGNTSPRGLSRVTGSPRLLARRRAQSGSGGPTVAPETGGPRTFFESAAASVYAAHGIDMLLELAPFAGSALNS